MNNLKTMAPKQNHKWNSDDVTLKNIPETLIITVLQQGFFYREGITNSNATAKVNFMYGRGLGMGYFILMT